MPHGIPDNPPAAHPNQARGDPASYPILLQTRPSAIVDLLSHREVIYPGWEVDVGTRPLYYVDGIIAFMRLLRVTQIVFLKDDRYLDKAMKTVEHDTDWRNQVNLRWSEDVAANQLRRIQQRRAVSFTKAVYTIVACEHAIESSGITSPLWPYQYMRIIPAVYNIDKLNKETLTALLAKPNARANLESIAGANSLDILKEVIEGGCITAKTAHELSAFFSHHPDVGIGGVRFKPGKKRLGKKNACTTEEVEIH